MVHEVTKDNLNYRSVELFNYNRCELFSDNIGRQRRFISCTRVSDQKTATAMIMMGRPVLEMG
jgi:hypothetical protein